jgi:hypothetical protein
MKESELKEGKVYYPSRICLNHKYKYRRIVSIRDGKVVFCCGDDQLYSCSIKAFLQACTTKRPKP